MSQKEMDAMDAQVMDVANRVPKETRTGKPEIATSGACPPRNDKIVAGTMHGTGKYEDAVSAEHWRKVLWTVIKVLVCILVGALFVAALADPGFVVHLVNIGVLACGIVAAIIIDRFIRGRQ